MPYKDIAGGIGKSCVSDVKMSRDSALYGKYSPMQLAFNIFFIYYPHNVFSCFCCGNNMRFQFSTFPQRYQYINSL